MPHNPFLSLADDWGERDTENGVWEGSLDSSAGFRPVWVTVLQGRPHAKWSGRWQKHPWCSLCLTSLHLGRAHLRRPSLNVTFSLGRSQALRQNSHSLLCASSLSPISHLLVHVIDYFVQSWLSSEAVTFSRAETVFPFPYISRILHSSWHIKECLTNWEKMTRYLKY